MRSLGAAAVAFVAAPLLVLASIWLPVWQHYRVAPASVEAQTIERLRRAPDDARLEALDRQAQGLRILLPDAPGHARSIAQGSLRLPSGEVRRTSLPFEAADFDGGTPGGALNMASLIVPDTLLAAFEASGDAAHLEQARRAIVAFAAFERDLDGDVGNVRNDHAIASRIGVLVRFWRHYRGRADFDADTARAVLEHAARSAAFLAKASHYTAATNHGVMQNIALLQASIAFAALPDAARWAATAHARLVQQAAFFANAEGVVLEHSSDYHRFGVQLLGMVQQLVAWSGLPAIDGLDVKYARGVLFADRLRRPDGSLPRIGDTSGELVHGAADSRFPARGGVDDLALALDDGTHIYPGAGYAVTRRPAQSAAFSHATVYWSHYPRHGHEVAAEGSFLLWAAGTDWIGNTGYWPYGIPGRAASEGWRGGNAPHLRGEPATSRRTSTLLAYGAAGDSGVIDVARTIEGGPRLRRQVVRIDDRRWLVLDSTQGEIGVPVDRLWTLAPHSEVQRHGARGYAARDPRSGWTLVLDFIGQAPPEVRRLQGTLEPYGGWAVVGSQPLPAPALEVAQSPSRRWVATLLTLAEPGQPLPRETAMLHFGAEEAWRLVLDGGGRAFAGVERAGSRLLVHGEGGAHNEVVLSKAPDKPLADRASVQQALAATLREYPKFRPLVPYRLRLSQAVAAAAVAGIVLALLLAISRRRLPRALPLACLAGLLFWAALAAWIHGRYLVV